MLLMGDASRKALEQLSNAFVRMSVPLHDIRRRPADRRLSAVMVGAAAPAARPVARSGFEALRATPDRGERLSIQRRRCGSPRASLPAVFAVNHTSYLDSVVCLHGGAADRMPLRRESPVGRDSLHRHSRSKGAVPDRKPDAAEGARQVHVGHLIETIRAGTSVVVYPEATTSRSGSLLPFRPGAFRVAVETQRPVVPVTISGTAAIWPRGSWMMRPGPIEVCIHERPSR